MDEHRQKILVVLVLTMAMHQVIVVFSTLFSKIVSLHSSFRSKKRERFRCEKILLNFFIQTSTIKDSSKLEFALFLCIFDKFKFHFSL